MRMAWRRLLLLAAAGFGTRAEAAAAAGAGAGVVGRRAGRLAGFVAPASGGEVVTGRQQRHGGGRSGGGVADGSYGVGVLSTTRRRSAEATAAAVAAGTHLAPTGRSLAATAPPRAIGATRRYGSNLEPEPLWGVLPPFDDQLVLAGDFMILTVYSYTQAVVDLIGTEILKVMKDSDTLIGTDIINIMTAPLFANPFFGVLALFLSFTVCGSITGHYNREITRADFEVHGICTLKTWAFSTLTLLAWLYSNDLQPGSEDFAFVCGSLTAMSMWRYIYSTVARFLP